MKNLLALVGLVVVVVAGAGWYLGWYKIGTEPTTAGHRKINVDVNTNKITEDLKKGREAVGDLIEKKVEGQPTSLPVFEGKGSLTLPPLPNLPAIPQSVPVEFNKDGSPKTPIRIDLPPPPLFPKQ